MLAVIFFLFINRIIYFLHIIVKLQFELEVFNELASYTSKKYTLFFYSCKSSTKFNFEFLTCLDFHLYYIQILFLKFLESLALLASTDKTLQVIVHETFNNKYIMYSILQIFQTCSTFFSVRNKCNKRLLIYICTQYFNLY